MYDIKQAEENRLKRMKDKSEGKEEHHLEMKYLCKIRWKQYRNRR